MMGCDRRSTRAGAQLLLIATVIQGFTPACDDLASCRLLHLAATSAIGDHVAGGEDASSRTPPCDDDAGVPGEISRTIAAAAGLRARLDDGVRHRHPFLAAHFLERPTRSGLRPLRAAGSVFRDPGGPIAFLCRFRC